MTEREEIARLVEIVKAHDEALSVVHYSATTRKVFSDALDRSQELLAAFKPDERAEVGYVKAFDASKPPVPGARPVWLHPPKPTEPFYVRDDDADDEPSEAGACYVRPQEFTGERPHKSASVINGAIEPGSTRCSATAAEVEEEVKKLRRLYADTPRSFWNDDAAWDAIARYVFAEREKAVNAALDERECEEKQVRQNCEREIERLNAEIARPKEEHAQAVRAAKREALVAACKASCTTCRRALWTADVCYWASHDEATGLRPSGHSVGCPPIRRLIAALDSEVTNG